MPSRTLAPMWLGLLVVAGCTSPGQMAGPRTQVPAVDPEMARVWFSDNPLAGNVYGSGANNLREQCAGRGDIRPGVLQVLRFCSRGWVRVDYGRLH